MSDLPSEKFGAVLADPPWQFITYSKKGRGRSADNHYDVMTWPEIGALPVIDIAADDCVLFLWTTDPMLARAMELIGVWGFTYKTVGFTWVKRNRVAPGWFTGMGYWTRANPEMCLLATRGNPKRRPTGTNVPQLIEAPRREHSRKPDDIYPRIERLVTGPYLELFARTNRLGWTSWGDEVEKFSTR